MNFFLRYLSSLFKSNNLHGIHSPFAYSLIRDVIYKCKNLPADHKAIEILRGKLKKDNALLSGEDFGAGNLKRKRSIGQFTATSSKPKKYSRLLYRLAKWHNPKYALELGTALGLSTIYQASGFNDTQFITLEGNSVLATKARHNLDTFNFKDVEIIEGNFDKTLIIALEKFPQVDWVFFDGNHQKIPTLKYFHLCMEKASDTALFIFDDINWSGGMQEAWAEIKSHPNVSLTIDLFFLGLVFFEKKRPQKENFVVRF